MMPLAIPAALSRIPWKWIGIGLLVAAVLVQTLRLSYAERRADKAQFALNEARTAIKEAHDATLRAQAEVDKTLKMMAVLRGKADDKASRIERVTLPGNCRTPREIMELDI